MKRVFDFIKNKATFLGAVTLAAIVGGATTAVVMAAIPDSNGQINACYKNSTKVLSVTDPTGNCAGNETALSWGQGNRAYATIDYDPNTDTVTIDSAHSSGITNLQRGSDGYACITVNFAPSFVISNTNNLYVFKDASNNWMGLNTGYTGQCDSVSGSNFALASFSNDTPDYYLIY